MATFSTISFGTIVKVGLVQTKPLPFDCVVFFNIDSFLLVKCQPLG